MKPSTTGGNANPSGSCFPSESLSENGNKPKPTSPPISRCSSNQGRKQPKQGPPLIDPIISTLEEKKKKKKTNTMSDQVGVGNAAHSKEGENHASESLKNTKVKKLRRGFGSDRLFFGDRP
ncbi:hypothetical protein IE53DRAFT_385406 [Violaceomyces palustris]|uniref:Uncharacterized protein n=1 Tax=Violaceomyces palustris TaxID=1673888 RepID=A0ACD0P2E0_9BASI|nr:hypothetical protein IE53DRAFT_385406 [Violaceomyces palustris]